MEPGLPDIYLHLSEKFSRAKVGISTASDEKARAFLQSATGRIGVEIRFTVRQIEREPSPAHHNFRKHCSSVLAWHMLAEYVSRVLILTKNSNWDIQCFHGSVLSNVHESKFIEESYRNLFQDISIYYIVNS